MAEWVPAIICFGLLFTLLALGERIALSMAIAGIVVLYLHSGTRLFGDISATAWQSFNSFTLTAIPLFLLAGQLAVHSGISERVFDALASWIYRLPGGLLLANIAFCTGFAAVSGSSMASTATIGRIAIGSQYARGYDLGDICGTVCGGGALGILIPPSILMIVYGDMVNAHIGSLFMAGVLPGLMVSGMFMLFIVAKALIKGDTPLAQAGIYTWRDRISGLFTTLIPAGCLVVVVLGGIYTGTFTPTEAGAVSVIGMFCFVIVYGKFSWKLLLNCLSETVLDVSKLLFIMLGTFILSFGLSRQRIPQMIAEIVVSMGASQTQVIMMLIVMYLVLGCLMEGFAIMLLTLPVIYPVLFSLDVNLVWFGILITLLMETSMLTPPIGINLFLVKGIAEASGIDAPIQKIIMGSLPFTVILIIGIGLVLAFPQIALFLVT
ncbi:TRAP transporter large permease [Thermodesulfobacteriota bacterium]